MGILSILGIGNNKIKEALRSGAIIIDVRTAHEFDEGKVPGSVNIPVDRIQANVERIRQMPRAVIVGGPSDDRNYKAVTILKANGLEEVYNGGSWTRVIRLLKSL